MSVVIETFPLFEENGNYWLLGMFKFLRLFDYSSFFFCAVTRSNMLFNIFIRLDQSVVQCAPTGVLRKR